MSWRIHEIYPILGSITRTQASVLVLGGRLPTSVVCIEIEHKMYLCYPGAEVSVTLCLAVSEASVGGLKGSVKDQARI
jgi:hypothetical protein